MKTGIKHITAFAISTLLAFSQCEKAETGSTEAGETGSGATTTLPLNIPDTPVDRPHAVDRGQTADAA